jgi:sporulation protein YlmC with PRC-barrel domain
MTGSGKRTRRVLSAGSLAGDRVRNSAGEDLGKIEEIMIDVPSGRVGYAVLSFGGFLGLGNKLFAVPWDAFTIDEAEKEFILNVDKKVLEDAPGFDKDNWPDMADPDFGSQIYGHYGYKPYWDESDVDISDPNSTATATAPCPAAAAAGPPATDLPRRERCYAAPAGFHPSVYFFSPVLASRPFIFSTMCR